MLMKRKRTIALVIALCLVISLLPACSGAASNSLSSTVVDYGDERAFEAALNRGENLEGKVVRIYVSEFHPDSALGYNLWSGEHLNFVSAKNPDIKAGETVTVRATSIENRLGSWVISYDVVTDWIIDSTTIVSESAGKADHTDAESQEPNEPGATETEAESITPPPTLSPIPVPQTTDSPSGNSSTDTQPTPKPESKEFKDLVVEESGYYLVQGYYGTYLYYGFYLYNPNESKIVQYPTVRITARDADGVLLGTEDQVLNAIYPLERYAHGFQAFKVDEVPASVSFEVVSPKERNIKSASTEKPYSPLFIVNYTKRDDKIVGEISNPNDYDFDLVAVTAIFRDSDGNLVCGDTTFVDDVAAGTTTPFEMSVSRYFSAFDFEMSAKPW